MKTRFQNKLADLKKIANLLTDIAYQLHFEYEGDRDNEPPTNFWALHESTSLLVHFLEEDDYDTYAQYARNYHEYLDMCLQDWPENEKSRKHFAEMKKMIEELFILS